VSPFRIFRRPLRRAEPYPWAGAGRDRDEDFAQARGTGTRDGENIPYLRLLRPIVPRGILSIEHRDEPKS